MPEHLSRQRAGVVVPLNHQNPIDEHVIDTLGPYMRGEMIGWSALVKPHIYTMGALAVEDTEVIGFNGEELLALMDSDKDNGYLVLRKLTELIGERLVNSSIQLMSMRA